MRRRLFHHPMYWSTSLIRLRRQLALGDAHPHDGVWRSPCTSLAVALPIEHQAHPKDTAAVPLAAFHSPPGLGGEIQRMGLATKRAGPEASTSHLGSDLKALRSHAFNTIRKKRQLSRIIMLTESPSIGGHGPAFSGLWPDLCQSFTNDLTKPFSVGTVVSALINRTWILCGLLSGP